MITDFAAFMAKQDHAFYPLRFMAADFFVPYWKCFTLVDLDPSHVRVAQEAARACVVHSMGDEEIYWNIDHSERNALATWRMFDERTRAIPDEPLRQIRSMAIQLAVSTDESTSADYLLNLMTRLSRDRSFRASVKCSDADANLLAAAHEDSAGEMVDMPEVKAGWLRSKTPWDLRLKSQTPDLEESVALIFSMAYGPRTALPLIQQNLRELVGSEQEYRELIARLKKIFERSRSENVAVKFPAVLDV